MMTKINNSSKQAKIFNRVFSALILISVLSIQSYSQGWSSLGGGTNWEYSLVVYNNELYAGEQSGSGGHGLKKFNGTTWSDFGGINGTVNAMII
jgi:hypothetical protein